MLKGISPYLSPDLLKVFHEMGHGDELLLADAHFPGHAIGRNVLRADGLTVSQMLDGILPLFELDTHSSPLAMMQASGTDSLDPRVETDFMRVIHRHVPEAPLPVRIERHDFYQRAKLSYAIVITGETRAYGNLLLRKGVTPRFEID